MLQSTKLPVYFRLKVNHTYTHIHEFGNVWAVLFPVKATGHTGAAGGLQVGSAWCCR